MKKILIFSIICSWIFAPIRSLLAVQEVLQDLTYSQRGGTKLVDLNYRLTLETGQTAEVTFTFSHDNGLTFPVACRSITGDVGKGLTSGYKSAVWDAGVDWPLQFTDWGRIKGTCAISDSSGGTPSEPPIQFEVISVPIIKSDIAHSPAWWINKHFSLGLQGGLINKEPSTLHCDKYEVTNYQWNKVVEWASSRGYDLEPVDYSDGEANLPRVNLPVRDVVKWLNARSEMEGLTPVYYIDQREWRCDVNGDGKISSGPDSWWGGEQPEDNDWMNNPNFDWSLIPNGKQNIAGGWIEFDPNYNGTWDQGEPFFDRNKNGLYDLGIDSLHPELPGDWEYQTNPSFDWSLIVNGKGNLQGGWINFDPNYNGRHDSGEPFYDRNRDGKFEPYEWSDLNHDGMLDDGLTAVCRSGDISSIASKIGGFSLFFHQKMHANGYRLPETGPMGPPFMHYLAMGGRAEQSEWGEVWDGHMHRQGLVYKEEWPWGTQSPDEKGNIDSLAITPFGSIRSAQSIGKTLPNGYGIHDLIGNVRELTSFWEKGNLLMGGHISPGGETLLLSAGGSYIHGFEKSWISDPIDPWGMGAEKISPTQVMNPDPWLIPDTMLGGYFESSTSEEGNPDVGFRGIRMTF